MEIDPLFTPEHLHVMLNHFPLIGVIAATIPLLFGIMRNSSTALAAGFFMCILFSGLTYPVMETGGKAADRFYDGDIHPNWDAEGEKWFEIHAHRADETAKFAYGLVGLSFIGLLCSWKIKKIQAFMGIITLLGCGVVIGLMSWVARAGGQIRHPEFRVETQSADLSKELHLFDD